MQENTLSQYDQAFAQCKDIFTDKMKDYGSAWMILRPSSLTDQIMIKAQRIRSLEEHGERRIHEGPEAEYIGIINYSLMALIRLSYPDWQAEQVSPGDILSAYRKEMEITRDLMIDKNHDYGEAWREMRISSMTDLILMKLLRIRQIEDNQGKTLISEGLDANYRDIINYSLFALIRYAEIQA